ncbi:MULTISPECIES: hypothetical protein [unclassified Mycolicibacterium]|uniref:hypothetical protein n=1 Tax=unclassified Mycolicibacterium TaxID=2636767 RepID=UPI0012DDF372|nr:MULTISPECIES: hypothetical protein [unclassified Mycolicibacterium]MUL84738.1 hypothetical protein [Mycolicibacterium sp. CBMA 329]MUL88513.1 hypothetical protein [Mycolicibacterium sp. CBMA 331]MUM00148.1 hypothetical protein [Mycolicibacterium sp. CBMA 334]MUM27812.1 hypothetical protein [Mycolicibacterium sp. CBMA 295]MUM40160.1 hypothetical protein [Mycolicibacterium sp. CBMA 247]
MRLLQHRSSRLAGDAVVVPVVEQVRIRISMASPMDATNSFQVVFSQPGGRWVLPTLGQALGADGQ